MQHQLTQYQLNIKVHAHILKFVIFHISFPAYFLILFLRKLPYFSSPLLHTRYSQQPNTIKLTNQNNLVINYIKYTTTMDIKDFQGLTKYKIFVPALYILSWISMFTGPSFFPVEYQKYCIVMIIYLLIRIIIVTASMIKINIDGCRNLSRLTSQSQGQQYQGFMDSEEDLNYGFIIPNYKEEIQLLCETLDFLAAQKRAKEHYLIFLAMQAHEPDSDLKAKQLLQKYKDSFRVIDYTRHEIRPNQQKGKASNVSWCAENLQPILQKNMINPNSLFVTIIDADSWAPDIYFDLIQEHIKENYDERYTFIYQPTQIFTRNFLDVPLMTRTMDVVHSFAHMGNLYSSFNFTFPLSNYTLSYDMIKRMGYWDTCADAIGQDFHTTQKAYWKTGGNMKAVPIYVPFNQVNISTGNGYWEDMKARFWQAERHAQGVADVAYNMKMLLNQPFRLKNLLVMYLVLQTFLITATLPWIFISMNYQSKILWEYQKPSPDLISQSAIGYLFTVMSVVGTFAYFTYEFYKRRANTIIYKQQNESLFRMIQYLLLVLVLLFFVSAPTFIIASFSCLFGNRQYIVADKKNAVKKNIDSH